MPHSHSLHQRLMTMVGDEATAARLLQQAQKQHPGESAEWYFDKVIYDLWRDRQ